MAKMGACGVRLELNDDSGYSQVESPNAVGAVVGFAPKGELNKIQRLTNIAEQELYFGRGFNNPRHNQGMYAARAVINAGGFVEFVRPYGEEIDKTDDFKRDLKTDAFVVAYDRYAAKNEQNLTKTSLNIEYFAATRYKSDRGAKYGMTRKINNIAETIVNGSNVDFGLSAGSEYSDKKNWVTNGGVARGKNDVVLFALMNADPSSANRAYTSYRLDTNEFDNSARDKGEITVTSLTKVGFAVNDIVCVPATGRITTLSKFIVKDIDDKEITLKAYDTDTEKNLIAGLKPEVIFYSDTENVVADNYDYLTVKTAVAGQGAKTFSALHLDDDGLAALKALPSGSAIVFNDQDANTVYVRVATPKATVLTQITRTSDPSAAADATTATIKVANPDAIWVGDRIQLNWPTEGIYSAVFTVTGEDTEANTLDISVAEIDSVSAAHIDNLFATDISAITLEAPSAEWVDSTNTINLYIDKDSTVESVITDLLAAVRSDLLEFGVNSVVTDIAKNDPVGTEKYGKIKLDADGVTVTVVPGGALNFLPGDIVAITRSSVEVDDSGEVYPEGAAQFNGTNIYWVGKVKNSDPISDTIELSADISGITELTQDTYVGFQLLNLTQTNKVAYAAVSNYEVKQEKVTDVSGTVKTGEGYTSLTVGTDPVDPGDATANPPRMPKYLVSGSVSFEGDGTAIPSVGDTVKYKWQGATRTARVTEVVPAVEGGLPLHYVASFESAQIEGSFDGENHPVPPQTAGDVSALTYDGIVEHEDDTKSFGDIYFVGNFTTSVPSAIQTTTAVVEKDDVFVGDSAPFKYFDGNYKKKGALIAQTEKVLTDTSIGATFVSLGLATLKYEDINFTGDTVKVYDLTDDGEAVARLYLSVAYMYNGNLYEFDGTIVRYVYNDRQLYIGDTAKVELEGSGVKFVLNEDDVIEMFREDNSYDLSNTVVGELQDDGSYKAIPSAVMTCPSFNENDPAIINNGVWVYDPNNNKSTSTLSNAYNLYLDKDKSDVSFFVAAGSNVNNFGFKGYESLNTQLMQAILNICELRKDCFALFDAAGDARIKQALKLNAPASQFGSTLGRWGAIYDNRPIFSDTYITKSQVELAPSIAMASLITSNRRGSVYWHVPAGEILGKVPGAWCSEMKYDRSFLIPESPDSDIAKLSDIHVNPFRCNEKGGIYAFGDFTMQMEDTAFNAINVTMLVAQIHKSFYNYLDARVFQLNTAELRSTITTDLQAKIDAIVGEHPAGLEVGSYVKCDNENNPPEIVEAHKLMVDLYLYPTTSTRYIYLRTNVLSRSSGNTITTDITTGSR